MENPRRRAESRTITVRAPPTIDRWTRRSKVTRNCRISTTISPPSSCFPPARTRAHFGARRSSGTSPMERTARSTLSACSASHCMSPAPEVFTSRPNFRPGEFLSICCPFLVYFWSSPSKFMAENYCQHSKTNH